MNGNTKKLLGKKRRSMNIIRVYVPTSTKRGDMLIHKTDGPAVGQGSKIDSGKLRADSGKQPGLISLST